MPLGLTYLQQYESHPSIVFFWLLLLRIKSTIGAFIFLTLLKLIIFIFSGLKELDQISPSPQQHLHWMNSIERLKLTSSYIGHERQLQNSWIFYGERKSQPAAFFRHDHVGICIISISKWGAARQVFQIYSVYYTKKRKRKFGFWSSSSYYTRLWLLVQSGQEVATW